MFSNHNRIKLETSNKMLKKKKDIFKNLKLSNILPNKPSIKQKSQTGQLHVKEWN